MKSTTFRLLGATLAALTFSFVPTNFIPPNRTSDLYLSTLVEDKAGREPVTRVSKKFSDLENRVAGGRVYRDSAIRKTIFRIAGQMTYVFPLPEASEDAKEAAFGGSRKFGAKRGNDYHRGVDILGFGPEVVAFADGEVAAVGRNANSFDHGNLVVLDHGLVEGYAVYTYYLHLGAIPSDLKPKVRIKKGEPFARADCTGMPSRLNTAACREKGHLHFQIRLGDRYVNPALFFPEYSACLSSLKGNQLSLPAGNLNGIARPFRNSRQALGSFDKPVYFGKNTGNLAARLLQ